jgi:hypothetical protein
MFTRGNHIGLFEVGFSLRLFTLVMDSVHFSLRLFTLVMDSVHFGQQFRDIAA